MCMLCVREGELQGIWRFGVGEEDEEKEEEEEKEYSRIQEGQHKSHGCPTKLGKALGNQFNLCIWIWGGEAYIAQSFPHMTSY